MFAQRLAFRHRVEGALAVFTIYGLYILLGWHTNIVNNLTLTWASGKDLAAKSDIPLYQCLELAASGPESFCQLGSLKNYIKEESVKAAEHLCYAPDDFKRPENYRFKEVNLNKIKLPPTDFDAALKYFGYTEKMYADSTLVVGNLSPLQHNLERAKKRGVFKIGILGESHSAGARLTENDCLTTSVCTMWEIFSAWMYLKLKIHVSYINRSTGAATGAMFGICGSSYQNLSDIDLIILETSTADIRGMGELYATKGETAADISVEFFHRNSLVYGNLTQMPYVLTVYVLGGFDNINSAPLPNKVARHYNTSFLAPYLGMRQELVTNKKKYTAYDGLHPNGAGHQFYAAFVYLFILKEMAKLPEKLLPEFKLAIDHPSMSKSSLMNSIRGSAGFCLPTVLHQKSLVRPQPLPAIWRTQGAVRQICPPPKDFGNGIRVDSPTFFEVYKPSGMNSLQIMFWSPKLPVYAKSIHLAYMELSNYGTNTKEYNKNIYVIKVTVKSPGKAEMSSSSMTLVSGVFHTLVPQIVDPGITVEPDTFYNVIFENDQAVVAKIHGIFVYFT